MRRHARATAWALALFAVSLFASLAASTSQAADLIWEVESPFRFFKSTRAFALHEAAFNAVRGDPSQPLPPDIIWRTERALNDPDCQDASTPDRCAATAGKRYQQSRLGWAAQTLGETCYESNGRLRRYSALCERRYSWGTAREDYVLPDAHTVLIRIAPQQLGGTNGECAWSWQARKAGGKTESKRIACTDKLTIARVPYALDRTQSGVSVTVKLPDGRELTEPEVVVEDLFIVALGDSFASGESNPDPCCAPASRRKRRPGVPRRTTGSPPATIGTIPRSYRGGSWTTRRPSAFTVSAHPNSWPHSRRRRHAG
jgi:hypothetical protein